MPAKQPVFYYDLASPRCYLAAEQLGGHAVWEPVLQAELGPTREVDRAKVEQQALELGIQPFRWPDVWPPNSRRAMLAATYAKQIGRAVAFSLAAFRQAFAAGRDLGDDDTILIAGAACEMHPTALLKGMSLRGTAQALAEAAERARLHGVAELPAVIR